MNNLFSQDAFLRISFEKKKPGVVLFCLANILIYSVMSRKVHTLYMHLTLMFVFTDYHSVYYSYMTTLAI